ncbi:hypothetical protein ACJJTC_000465, partial [Scirpophaga incertulas]
VFIISYFPHQYSPPLVNIWSTAVCAQKLAVRAEVLRRQVDRERKLAQLEYQAEQAEMQAKLAALETTDKPNKSRSYFSDRSCNRRITSWILDQNANMTETAHGTIPGGALTVTSSIRDTHLQPDAPTTSVPVLCASPVKHAVQSQSTKSLPTAAQLPTDAQLPTEPITQLANAITALSNRPKKPELVTFSGEFEQWMAFKSSYEKSKCNFSAAENITRLNNAVRGAAYQSVASLLWTSSDPQEVMDALEQTYARPEIMVTRQVAELRSYIKLSSPEHLNALANKLRNFIATLKVLNQNDYLYSPELFRCVLVKLSEHTRGRFTDFAASNCPAENNTSKLEILSRFLLIEADKQLKYNFVSDSAMNVQSRSLSFKKESTHVITSGNRPIICTYCRQEQHTIKMCKKFRCLSVDDRWRWITGAKICYRCLKSNPHTWNNCQAKPCGVQGCRRRHNSLLHGSASTISAQISDGCNINDVTLECPTKISTSPNTDFDSVKTNIDCVSNVTGSTSRPRGLLKVLPVVVEGPGGVYETVALLDEGSTATLIDADVAAAVGASPAAQAPERLRIEGVGGMATTVDVRYVHFYIRGRNLTERYLVESARAIKPLALQELRSYSDSEVYLPPNSEVGVLGVKWNPSQDLLTFRPAPHSIDVLTKRSLLSHVMKVYDPLGLLMPVIVWGRILIQKLWREGIDWDSPLPDKYVAECHDWFCQLQDTANLQIPRWYMIKADPTDIQLHVICDGGEQAYACVAYWRFKYDDNTVSTAMIGSKARVAPLKPLSIPRLELQAALIASRFAQTILHAHRYTPSETTLWTDSTTVLKWIRSDARKFKPFVAHRLGEILETTNSSNWKWIPTCLNVADDATKPKRLNLSPSHRWFTGPSFLLEPKCNWPTEETLSIDEALLQSELKLEFIALLADAPLLDPPVPNAARFSTWLRLLRTTARIIQCARIFRNKLSRPILQNSKLFSDGTTSPSQLRVSDIMQAEKQLLQRAQMDSFPEEFTALRAAQPLSKSSRLAALTLVLDDDNLLRLHTRIGSAPGVTDNIKSPIVLDGRHHIVRLLIYHYHIEAAHAFHELVLNELRQRFHILRARTTIRNVANLCPKCRRWNSQVNTPQVGQLPPERLDHHKRPFTHLKHGATYLCRGAAQVSYWLGCSRSMVHPTYVEVQHRYRTGSGVVKA